MLPTKHLRDTYLDPLPQNPSSFSPGSPQNSLGSPSPALSSQQHPSCSEGKHNTQNVTQIPKWLLTGVIGHQLLQAVELGAGGDVEATTVQLADLVVLHVEPLGVVEVRDGEAVGT